MDANTRNVISDLHSEQDESRLSKTEWKALLATRLDKQTLAIISNEAQAGMLYLKDPDIRELAVTENPWMAKVFDYTRKDSRSGKESVIKTRPWIERIQDGVLKPKDLIHLSNVVFLAENRDVIETLNF